MAECMMKVLYGQDYYVQACGVRSDLDVDRFAVSVCTELGAELERHKSRSFDEMQEWGDDLSGFDLVVALSPASQRRALDLTRYYHLDVEYCPILDPSGMGEAREEKLGYYRQTRDQIRNRIIERFGPPTNTDCDMGGSE